jgi:hypothetical protein
MNDAIFLKKLYEITSDLDIKRIITLTDSTDLTTIDEQDIELFFIKLGNHIGSLYDAMVLFCDHFDCDLNMIIANTTILEKVSAERKGKSLMEDYFV